MNELEDIKDRIDIVELISSYINLKKAGQNYKGLCPFHKEKTPSFMVSPQKQIWHCFGCSEGGDVFGFIMRMESMEFPEALRFLAQKAGVAIKAPTHDYQEKSSQKNILMELNDLAASFYHKVLEESQEAAVAREYLKKRSVDESTVLEFRLGYAPPGFSHLLEFLQKKGFSKEDIIRTGLAVRKDNGQIADRFYKRLMFPIINPSGAVLGFTARILTNEKDSKYINTPETPIYEKSRVLFGLDKAKKEILERKWVVIVEGNMDVLASNQAGVKNVIASSGTALTREQLRIIKRYTPNIILALDKDEAGSEALKRGIYLALEEGMDIKIADLKDYKDPDEMIKAEKNLWKKTLKESQPFLDFYFDEFFAKISKSKLDATSKKKLAREILPFLKRMQDSIEQAHYIKNLAKILQVPEPSITEALKKVKTEKIIESRESEPQKTKKSPQKLLSEALLGLILSFPVTTSEITSLLEEENFEAPKDKELFKIFQKTFKQKGEFHINDIKDAELNSRASELMLIAEENHKESDNEAIVEEAKFCFKRLKGLKIKESERDLQSKIEEAEEKNQTSELNNLMKELQKVLDKEKELKEF